MTFSIPNIINAYKNLAYQLKSNTNQYRVLILSTLIFIGFSWLIAVIIETNFYGYTYPELISGGYLIAIFDTLSFSVTAISAAFVFLHFSNKKDYISPLLGTILVIISLIDFVLLIIEFSKFTQNSSQLQSSIQVSYMFTRVLFGVSVGVISLSVLKRNKWLRNSNLRNLITYAALISLLNFVLIAAFFLLESEFQVLGSWFSLRNGYIISLIIILFNLLIVLPVFLKQFNSIYGFSFLVAMLPAISAECASLLSEIPYDFWNVVSNFFKFLSYATPLVGLLINYSQIQNNEKKLIGILAQEASSRKVTYDFLQGVLNSVKDGVISTQIIRDERKKPLDLAILQLNAAAERILGIKNNKETGDFLFENLFTKESTELKASLLKVFTTNVNTEIEGFEYEHQTLGKRILNISAVKLGEGIVLTISDETEALTAEKALLESKLKFEAIFNQTLQFIGLLNPEGKLLEINESATSFLQKPAEELIGIYFWDIEAIAQDAALQTQIKAAIRAGNQGKIVRFNVELPNPITGEIAVVDFTVKPIFDASGKVAFLIPEGRDITADIAISNRVAKSEAFLAEAQQMAKIGSWELELFPERLEWSKELYRLVGYEVGEVQPSVALFNEHIQKEYFEKILIETSAKVAKGEEFEMEQPIVTKQGEEKILLVKTRFVKNEKGEVVKILGVSMDITEQKRYIQSIKRSEQLYRKLAANIPDSFIWMSNDKGIISIAEGLEQTKLFPPYISFEGSYIENALNLLDNNEELLQAYQTALEGNVQEVEFKYKDFFYNISFIPVHNEQRKLSNIVALFFNITKLKKYQTKLQENIQELARSNQELEQFAYVASHDLQEPLRKIRTLGDRLKSKYQNALPEEGLDYIARMQNASQRMQNLITDLLNFSRISTSDRPFKKTDLNQIINSVISDLESLIERKEATIELSELPEIIGDGALLNQLFLNLLSNALKFSAADRNPVVVIESVELAKAAYTPEAFGSIVQKNLYCLITIRDNGIGFDNIYAEKIFTIFQRLHGKSEYEGTGIGLAIVKKVVERHKGAIVAESIPNEGTTFFILLPYTQNDYLISYAPNDQPY